MPRFRTRGAKPVMYPYDTPPRKGDFGLTAGGGLAMLVTRLGTLSRYGHACVALNDPMLAGDLNHPEGQYEVIRIIEAAPGRQGARIKTVRTSAFRWSNLQIDPEVRDRIAARAESCKGIKYDWPAIFGFMAKVWGYKLRLIGRKDQPDDRMICSELVVWAYRPDIDLAPGLPAGAVSPGDLGDYLVSH